VEGGGEANAKCGKANAGAIDTRPGCEVRPDRIWSDLEEALSEMHI